MPTLHVSRRHLKLHMMSVARIVLMKLYIHLEYTLLNCRSFTLLYDVANQTNMQLSSDR